MELNAMTIGIIRSATQINDAMARVYGHMTMAVLTSMIVSMLVASNSVAMSILFGTALKWIVIFAPLAAIFAISWVLQNNPGKNTALLCLHGFAALMGLSFATIFVVYTSMSIFTAFLGAAVLFATMSFYGYFTKQSLDSLGKYLFIALIAIIITSVVNIFIGSSMLQTLISAAAVLIFLGLTAYDTQQIRETLMIEDEQSNEIRGALTLYLDFINLFLSLLQLTGTKNE
jgi:FtsH-binding integral membrane protein